MACKSSIQRFSQLSLKHMPGYCVSSIKDQQASCRLELTQNIHPTIISICLCRCWCYMHLAVICWATASRKRSVPQRECWAKQKLTPKMAAGPKQFALPQVYYCCQGMNHSEKTCHLCVNTPAKSYRAAAAVESIAAGDDTHMTC